VQEWVIAAIGVGGTLGGTGLGYRGALSINKRDRQTRLRDQIRSAFAEYLGALYVSVGELRDLPPRQEPNLLDKTADAIRGEQGSFIARRRAEYKLSGDRYREVASRLAAAAARLHVLPLSPELDEAVSAASRYVERLGEQRTPELKAEWPEVRARLLGAVEYLNEGAWE
jgi:hypothetical protein